MCIYLNRPLDDIPPERVRLEAEAVVTLLPAVEDGQGDWIGSAYLDDGRSARLRPRRSGAVSLRLLGGAVAPGPAVAEPEGTAIG